MTGISDKALVRIAQYWEGEEDLQDVPTERDVEYMRTEDTHPMYDEEYHQGLKEQELQGDAETLYRSAYEALAEAIAGKYNREARGRLWDLIMEDPEEFLRKAYGEVRLYE